MEKSSRSSKSNNQNINLSAIYSDKELESLKKIFPKLSSLIIAFPCKSVERGSLKPTKFNYFIEKNKFVKLITEKMTNILKKEDSEILARSLSYILNNDPGLKNMTTNGNVVDSAKSTKNQIHVNLTEKQKNNGETVFFKQKTQNKKILKEPNSKNKNNKNHFPYIRKSMKLNIENLPTYKNARNKLLGSKLFDFKDKENSDYRIKNVKSNSIINNFITFSNMSHPEQIIVYGNNNSSKSRKSNRLNNSNQNKKREEMNKKYLSLNFIANYISKEKNNQRDIRKKTVKFNSLKSNFLDNNMNNNIKKIDKIQTIYNLQNRKYSGRVKKRQSIVTTTISKTLTTQTFDNLANNTTLNKKISIQSKPNIKEKDLSNIKNINLISNSNFESKDFDIFNFESSVGKEHTLLLISSFIFNKFDFSKIVKQKKFLTWTKNIASGYSRKNPYHTDLHAADVTQTCFLSLLQEGVKEISMVNNIDICSLILSCMCHDFKHGGLNNLFLKLTKHKLAIRYNDISILENMHISETFKLINSNPECDIFSGVEKPTYEKMRKQMISCVLSTDMAFHSNHVEFMNNIINKKISNPQDNQEFMNLLIHAADISNPTKPFNVYLKWAKLVFEEFCQQGDKEKALGLNCTCDRNTVKLSKNQIGFIDFVVDGFVTIYVKVFPSLKFLKDNLVNNREQFVNYKDEDNNSNVNNKKEIKK